MSKNISEFSLIRKCLSLEEFNNEVFCIDEHDHEIKMKETKASLIIEGCSRSACIVLKVNSINFMSQFKTVWLPKIQAVKQDHIADSKHWIGE